MTRKRSNIVCPVCNEIGGSLKKKWVFKPAHIPKLEKIDNKSKGWDYAAKVLLRMRDNFILFPPDFSSDETLSTGIYVHFSGFTEGHISDLCTVLSHLDLTAIYFALRTLLCGKYLDLSAARQIAEYANGSA